MKKIFIGFLFIFLHFTININAAKLELLPNFAGYILLFMGMGEHLSESVHFVKAKTACIPMIVYEALVWVFNLTTIGVMIPSIVFTILSIVFTVCSFYIFYQIVMAILDIETANSYPLGAGKMKNAWFVMAVTNGIAAIAVLIPGLNALIVAGAVFSLVALVAAIVYVVFFYQAQKKYFVMKAHKAKEAETGMMEEMQE